MVDSAIHRINLYPVDKGNCTNLYGEKHYTPFQQLGPEQEWQKMDKVNTSIQQRHR